jgi:hypothetical protein
VEREKLMQNFVEETIWGMFICRADKERQVGLRQKWWWKVLAQNRVL